MKWNDPSVYEYEQSIRRKIAGYPLLYDITSRLMTEAVAKREANLLVIGAGGGEELVTMASKEKGWSFTAIDASQPMLELARVRTDREKANDRIRYRLTTLESFSESALYDGVTCLLVLHFVKGKANKRQFLEKLASYIRAGAPLCLAMINGDPTSRVFSVQMAAWREHMISQGIEELQFEQFADSIGDTTDLITEKELLALLRNCQFEDVGCYFRSYLIDAYICFKRRRE
ncbi:class I SAM-dependent methyltransferase [Alkalihalobacillus hemicellulosilyticus]|uniref:Putative methyltransferase n=1 Tax=Halalkalibacter hemicellulosilyticusJCM 9152 TaxID=1236971 RepID=W4QBM0_9BACI|nr:class I SAM-dependent methyltransferase [Halalkalibacter hemicellulosilyticus]GAE28799.1 putative methyltransferase [Halalkalibacter hemicellulosilyticusJCM 9152]